MQNYQINDFKFIGNLFTHILYGEIKPLIIALCICIFLDKAIIAMLLFQRLVDTKKIPTLKTRIEN